MYKSIIIVAAVCLFCLASGAPTKETAEVRQGMKTAFEAGLSRFGDGIVKETPKFPEFGPQNKERIFSLYTRGIKAPGGGKPRTNDQYINHHFLPLAPTVIPEEVGPINGKITADQAAKMFKPRRTYQFTSERQHI